MRDEDKNLAKLIFRAALFLLCAYTVLMSVRLSIAPMQPSGMTFIVLTVILLLTTMAMTYRCVLIKPAAHFLLSGLLMLVIARAYTAGGSESPILIVGIMFPIMAVYLLGNVFGVVYAILVAAFVLGMIMMSVAGYEFPSLIMDNRALEIMQGTIIIFVMAVCSWITWVYAHYNELLKKRLLEETRRDHLTHIPNRRAFDHALEAEVKRAHRRGKALTLFMVDLDYFKNYNDHYGHQMGDECLIQVADIIQSCLRRPGDLAARYGGEEFAVILPDTTLPQAQKLAETIRHAVIGLRITHKQSEYGVVTITLGVSSLNIDSDMSSEQLLGMADKALYQGKEGGRNQVCSI